VLLLDPMLATGGSAVAAVRRCKDAGARSIRFVCLLAAPVGVSALHNAPLPQGCQSRLAELHELQYAPLRAALVELGVAEPDVTLRLLVGLCAGAVHAVAEGAAKRDVLARVLTLVHHGLQPAS